MSRDEKKRILAIPTQENIWDRRQDETPKAWEAFQLYRDMGVGRNLTALSRDLAKSRDLIKRWHRKYDWGIRASTWDGHLDKIGQKITEEATADNMKQRHADIGVRMQTIASKRIDDFVTNPELSGTLSARDVISLAKEGTEIERNARTDEEKNKGGGNITFNLFMGGMPKWAPKTLPVKVIEGEVVSDESIVVAMGGPNGN